MTSVFHFDDVESQIKLVEKAREKKERLRYKVEHPDSCGSDYWCESDFPTNFDLEREEIKLNKMKDNHKVSKFEKILNKRKEAVAMRKASERDHFRILWLRQDGKCLFCKGSR